MKRKHESKMIESTRSLFKSFLNLNTNLDLKKKKNLLTKFDSSIDEKSIYDIINLSPKEIKVVMDSNKYFFGN